VRTAFRSAIGTPSRAFQTVFVQVAKDPGTLVHVLHRSNDDPDLF
jgi:hypothetical protein